MPLLTETLKDKCSSNAWLWISEPFSKHLGQGFGWFSRPVVQSWVLESHLANNVRKMVNQGTRVVAFFSSQSACGQSVCCILRSIALINTITPPNESVIITQVSCWCCSISDISVITENPWRSYPRFKRTLDATLAHAHLCRHTWLKQNSPLTETAVCSHLNLSIHRTWQIGRASCRERV